MPSIAFAQSIQSHVPVAPGEVSGATVRAALEEVFATHGRLRSYLLDDRGVVRKHVTVIVDGQPVRDRETLADPLGPNSEIFVMQALSGG